MNGGFDTTEMAGRKQDGGTAVAMAPEAAGGMAGGGFPVDIEVRQQAIGMGIAADEAGNAGRGEPVLDLFGCAIQHPGVAGRFGDEGGKVLGGVAVFKPSGGEQLERGAILAKGAAKVVDFEQHRLGQLFEPSWREKADAEHFGAARCEFAWHDKDASFGSRASRADDALLLEPLQGEAHGVAADFERLGKRAFPRQPAGPFTGFDAEADDADAFLDQTVPDRHRRFSHGNKLFLTDGDASEIRRRNVKLVCCKDQNAAVANGFQSMRCSGPNQTAHPNANSHVHPDSHRPEGRCRSRW